MRRTLVLAWFFGGIVWLTVVLPTLAVVPMTAPPLPERVALADLIVIGKIARLEDDAVEALPLMKIPGVSKKLSYRVAVVTIQSRLHGADKLETVRVAFLPPANDSKTSRAGNRLAVVRLAVGDEGCFFLRKHPDESFHVASAAYDFMDKSKTKSFDKELEQVKRSVRLLDDLKAGLGAKSAEDRLLTTSLLVYRYRTPKYVYRGKPKTEAIDVEQGRQMLATLAEADWNFKEDQTGMTPLNLFLRLGLTSADGWEPPVELKEVSAAAQKWLSNHKGDYRIRRFVPPDEAGK